MTDPRTESTAYVADLLARNHVYLSACHGRHREACEFLLQRQPEALPPRIIVVVGAGASNAACGLPTGFEAQKRLLEQFRSVDKSLILEEIHRLTVEYRLKEEDFETVLLALSKFDQASVLRELGHVFKRRHHPWLGYEIIAHWLKHRFVDAVVNFNFDEVLDQAVDDEMGGTGYYRVLSDGDCPGDPGDWIDFERNNRFKRPLYIKPHGTASHKSSMRFTRSSYTLLPRDLHHLLGKLFSHDELCVIVIGHAMKSVEFNDLLFREKRKRLELVFVDQKRPQLQEPDDGYTGHDLTSETKTTLEDTLLELAQGASSCFHPYAVPRGIQRHVLVSKIFRAEVDLDRDPREEASRVDRYLRDRIYVEIALAVAKAKGFLSSEHMAHGRVGRYYRLYRREPEPNRSIPSILSFCADLGLQAFGYAADTVFLPAREPDRVRNPTVDPDEFKELKQGLAARTRDNLSPQLQAEISIEELERVLMAMYGGDEVEVSADPDAFATRVFATPTVLGTLTALHLETGRMLAMDDWDALVCTAETGEWLLNANVSKEIRKRCARLAVIAADETHRDRLKEAYPWLGSEWRWLPWWLHNRHATIFLKEQKPIRAIFFERRLRTLQIVPLALSGNDADLAFQSFVAYWIKAGLFSKGRDRYIDRKLLQKERSALIARLYVQNPGGVGVKVPAMAIAPPLPGGE